MTKIQSRSALGVFRLILLVGVISGLGCLGLVVTAWGHDRSAVILGLTTLVFFAIAVWVIWMLARRAPDESPVTEQQQRQLQTLDIRRRQAQGNRLSR